MEKKEFKYEMLVRRSKEIADEYKDIDIELTIRQIYYRLVVNKEIPNNRSQYVYFDKSITDYRKKDLDFANLFIDDSRDKLKECYISYPLWEFTQIIKERINQVKNGYPTFTFNENLLQNKVNVILLEKNALKQLFEISITPNTILVCSRGINSFGQMNSLRKVLENDNRELHLFCFTDYDDTGYFIQENFIEQMKKYLGINFDSIKRIGLTNEQIKKMKLPIDPTAKAKKQLKSTHKDYDLEYFVELDAIEPRTLMKLVNDTCKQNYDTELYNSIEKTMKIRNRRLKNKYFKKLKNIDLSKI